ncbi:MAG: hypothetical protein IJ047_00355 [Paludibacteraceae bacterium]|nr:hypothetical protein [Paludibacteraceae bacterium]
MPTNRDIWHWQEPRTAWKGVGIYHVTLTIPSREPLLGELVIPNNDPKQARVERTELGDAVLDCQRTILDFHPEIQILQYCLMPDHLHSIWYVRSHMEHGIRYAVQGFWRAVKKIGRAYSYIRLSGGTMDENYNLSLFAPAESRDNPLRGRIGEEEYRHLDPIFTEMPFIRPMSHKGQLQNMIRYVQMNPQRLATKKLMPGFFRVQEGIEIAGRMYRGIGNAALLQAAKYVPVHVRRTMIDEAMHGDNTRLRDYMNGCVLAARQGAVMVSPFISDKEKEGMVVLLAEEHPIIYIVDNGFGDYYKPSDGLFDSVAAGRVLILSPWEYDPSKRHVTREECVAMNQMAEEICSL